MPRSLVVVLGLLFPLASLAQSVRGTVVTAGAEPVSGVVVQLVDSASEVAVRALTNERGEFRLPAVPGTYRLRTLRIGFRPATSPPFVLRAGEDRSHDLTLTGLPVRLGTVQIVGRNPCSTLADSAGGVHLVWEQVRTALTAAQLSAGTRTMTATIIGFDRTLDPSARQIREQSTSVRQALVAQPWGVLALDSLRRTGYVVVDRGGNVTYHAPGLSTLLSVGFAEDHCFRLAPTSDADRIGISFEPTPARRRVPEIRGTLWLDRASSELRSLEFDYVNIDSRRRQHAGGEMHFARMADGGWVISRWSVSMPELERRFAGPRSAEVETRVASIKVMGGELSVVRRGQDTLWSRPPLALAGRVIDSATSVPIAGAHVTLSGTSGEATSDATGHFTIPGILPGAYTVQVRTPSLDSVGAVHQALLALSDSTTRQELRVPTARQIISDLCGSRFNAASSASGIVVGTLSARGDSVSLSGARVVVEWDDLIVRVGTESFRTEGRRRRLDVRTTSTGAFRACGVPIDTDLTVRAEVGGGTAEPSVVRIPLAQRIVRAALLLDPRADRGAVFLGVVLADSTHAPIVGAEVALPQLAKRALTDERGEFRLADIPGGTHRVTVRRIGYGPFDGQLAFVPNRTVERQILLASVAVLDTVVVSATRTAIPSFEEHRRTGLGRFLTREQLAPQEGRRLADILTQVSGVDVVTGRGNHSWAATTRGTRSLNAPSCELDQIDEIAGAKPCACYARVYLDNMLIYRGDPREPLFDLNRMLPSQIEAIEFYAGPAQTPLRYSGLNSACGVLVIHTRRSP